MAATGILTGVSNPLRNLDQIELLPFNSFNLLMSPPDSYLMNGKIKVTFDPDTAMSVKVEIVTTAGNSPSASNRVYVNIAGMQYTLDSATLLTVEWPMGSDTFGFIADGQAFQYLNLFCYLCYNPNDGVYLGVHRRPGLHLYGDCTARGTDTSLEMYVSTSLVTAPVATDRMELVGRFRIPQTGTGGWGYPSELVYRNLPMTDLIPYAPTHTGFSANPTVTAKYRIIGNIVFLYYYTSAYGTSNATSYTFTLPIPMSVNQPQQNIPFSGVDNGAAMMGSAVLTPGSPTIVTLRTDALTAAWTNSGNKGAWVALQYTI